MTQATDVKELVKHLRSGGRTGERDDAADTIERLLTEIATLENDIAELQMGAEDVRSATIEECAKVADRYLIEGHEDIAADIRALLTKGEAG